MRVAERLGELGLRLPDPPQPRGKYVPVAVHDGTAHVSGQLSRQGNRVIAGPVTSGTAPELVAQAGQAWALRALSALGGAIGGLSTDTPGEVTRLAKRLDATYRDTAANVPKNASVQVDGGDLVLSALDKLGEPASLVVLKAAVAAGLPRVDLPELLLEMHARTGFANGFTHASEGGARAGGVATSICAVLLAEACNTGFEPLIRRDTPALGRSRLSWMRQNYVRAETLTRANAALVGAQNRIPLARTWGGGDVASADWLRLIVPVRTIHSGPNPRYFGQERGVTFYNLVSDQFTGLGGITVPGTLRDSLTLLSLALEQQTELQPTEIMSDAGAYTDTIFGIFRLLGFQFSPRLADIGGTRFWRVDGKADYGALDELAAQRVNVALIVQHWEDLLRLAGSLKLGTVQAAGLIRTLQTKNRLTKLARALEELGRLIKTLYLLRFIDDAAYRRRILVQLNRGEGRHQLARTVFHGKRGELRQRYREGQEDQLGVLGLVVNVTVPWNTIYMDAALNQLRAEGFDVRPEDAARLSPLGFDHINMLGRYAFILPDGIARGELIPTRLRIDLCPSPIGYGDDPIQITNEEGPGVAARLDDGVIALPNRHVQRVAAQVFPDVFQGGSIQGCRVPAAPAWQYPARQAHRPCDAIQRRRGPALHGRRARPAR